MSSQTALTETRPLGIATFSAIGTQASVLTIEPLAIGAARRMLRSELDRLDATCSRFRDSELTRLSATAGSWTPISPLLSALLEAALDAARRTDGTVDPTVGAAVSALGYDTDFEVMEPDDPRPRPGRPIPAPGWDQIELDSERCMIRVPVGVELDLGSSAKAWMADRTAGRIAAVLETGTLVNLGGDIGTCGETPTGGWQVGLHRDARTRADGVDVVVALHGGGLASSGTGVRNWRRAGELLHHIVDPRTGDVAPSTWTLVTVAAPTCLEANAASTAAVVLGQQAADWLEDLGLPCRLVGEDGTVTVLGGWPKERAPT